MPNCITSSAVRLDQVAANLDHFDPRNGQAQTHRHPGTKHFVGQNANVLWIILELDDVVAAVVAAHQVRLRATPHPANMLDREQHVNGH